MVSNVRCTMRIVSVSFIQFVDPKIVQAMHQSPDCGWNQAHSCEPQLNLICEQH